MEQQELEIKERGDTCCQICTSRMCKHENKHPWLHEGEYHKSCSSKNWICPWYVGPKKKIIYDNGA